jgi:hypothetical protein
VRPGRRVVPLELPLVGTLGFGAPFTASTLY